MNKHSFKKLISCFLVFVFILSVIPFGIVSAANSDDLAFRLSVHGSEYSNESMRFFEIGGRFYIDLADAAKLTRFSFSEDNKKIIITQGVRTVAIEKDTGHMTDCGTIDQGNIDLPKRGGKYLCEAVPMLMYLGANVTIKNGTTLSVNMPSSTIWEALMPEYLDYCFARESLFGGAVISRVNLGLDIISGMLFAFTDGINLDEVFFYTRARYEAAFKEAMEVNVFDYSKAMNAAADDNLKANVYIDSESIMDMVEGFGSIYEKSTELAEIYLDDIVIPYVGESMKNLSEILSKSDLETVENAVQEIVDQLEKSLESAELYGTVIDFGSVILDSTLTSIKMLGYDADAVCALQNCTNDELLSAIGYVPPWKEAAEHLSAKLYDKELMFKSNFALEFANLIMKEVLKAGLKEMIGKFTSGANLYTLAISIGAMIANYMLKDSIEAFEADMNAMFLHRVQNDVALMVDALWFKARNDDSYSSEESLKELKDMFGLYYRTSIALFDNYAVSLEEFYGKSGAEQAETLAGRNTDSFANTMAEYLYKLTNCHIEPIPRFSSLRDDLLNTDFMTPFAEATPSPTPTAAPTAAPTSMPQEENGSSMSVDEIVEKLIQHYRNKFGDNYYIIFANEMTQNTQYYFFVLRYQGNSSANTYVMMINVNKNTGLVEDESMDSWHLW